MAEIIRIIITGSSGYCLVEDAFTDKLTICADSIRYEYKPFIEDDSNIARKWSYKTNSPAFQALFQAASAEVEAILNLEYDFDVTDVGETAFVVTYADKTKRERAFFGTDDSFKECFFIIRQMVPGCECVPAVLQTEEDYEDED